MKKNYFLILIVILLSSFGQDKINSDKLPEPFQLIPSPQNVQVNDGPGLKFGQLEQLILGDGIKRPVMGNILSQLTENERMGGKLSLKLDTSNTVPESEEGYILTISNGNVEIVSRGEAGLFYGCQTLEQLLEDAWDFNASIPSCKIVDFPVLPYRAVHFDVKHHLDHMNYYYESIDRLAAYKINAVIFEFEDKLRYKKQPLVGAPQAISIDEMAALTEYARDRNIEISPLVQGLGHATFILKHDKYADLRELRDNRWAFCPMDEGTYDVQFDLYSDAIKATPGSKYLHVGGDEIGNIGICPRCKPTADKEGHLALHLHWLNKVCKYAEENGRIPIVWDDAPLHESDLLQTTRNDFEKEKADSIWNAGVSELEELIPMFPTNCIYMRWNYTTIGNYGDSHVLDWYKDHGLKAMVATAAQSGPASLFPFEARDKHPERGTPAIKYFVEMAAEKQIEGMLNTAWDDRSPHFETYWHGFITSAEYAWSPGKRTLEECDKAYLQREHAVEYPDYVDVYQQLRRAAVFYERAFMRKGSRLDLANSLFELPGVAHWLPPKTYEGVRTNFDDILFDLPDPENPGEWSKDNAEKLLEADTLLQQYEYTSKALKELYNLSKRNRYHWEVFSAVNDFEVITSKMMLALKQCDTDDADALKKGIEEVRKTMDEFNIVWENLQEVYSKTRFLEYPDDYVPDRYFHFASGREDLSWMIQVEELLFKLVNDWIIDLDNRK